MRADPNTHDPQRASTGERAITIRAATPADAAAVRLLAKLDGVRRMHGDALIAELDGAPLAAIALESGAVAADPFQRTADAVRLLRLRRYQVRGKDGEPAPAWALLRRFAPRAAA